LVKLQPILSLLIIAAQKTITMANDFAKGVSVVLTGTANWARLTEKTGPDQMSGKYSVELTLDSASRDLLSGMKILDHVNVKRQDGTYKYEQPTVRLKTVSLPTIWDSQKNVFTDIIGNGSTMRVKATIKSYEMAGKKGLTCYINKGVVLNLVEMQANTEEDEALFAGLDATAPTATATTPAQSDDDLPF
jgi:hypothetical protein